MNRNIQHCARWLFVAILLGSVASVTGGVASDVAVESDKTVRRSVVDFGYSDQTADAFLAMVRTWHCREMQQRLERAARELKQGTISVAQYANIETATAEQLAKTIKKEIASAGLPVERSDECFELGYVANKHQTHCLGYAQMLYVLGNAIGLTVRGVQVEEHLVGPMPINAAHVACLVERRDGKTLQVDLTGPKIVSEAFAFREHYAKEGEGWRIKDRDNRLWLHPKILLLDRDGLVAMVYTMRGNALHNSHKLAESLAAHDKAVKLNPRCGVVYVNRAMCRADANQVAEATADWSKAIELMPRHPAVYFGRGGLYATTGQITEAIADYTKAIALDPKMVDAYANRAMVYAGMAQFDKALADFAKGIAIDPKNAALYANRAALYGNMGKQPEAIADCNMAIQCDSTSQHAYQIRAAAYAELSRTDEALADYTKLIALAPKSADAYMFRGAIYSETGKHAEAGADFSKAIELRPNNGMLYAFRGAVKAGLGEKEDAKKDFQKAIELDPEQIEYIKSLAGRSGVEL
jgi:tetratricopeptide (TPR) repeat protein